MGGAHQGERRDRGLSRYFVMAGHSRSKNGVASLAYGVPAIDAFVCWSMIRPDRTTHAVMPGLVPAIHVFVLAMH